MSDRPLVVAITGASGAPYAVRLLESLVAAGRRVQLIASSHGLRLLRTGNAPFGLPSPELGALIRVQ